MQLITPVLQSAPITNIVSNADLPITKIPDSLWGIPRSTSAATYNDDEILFSSDNGWCRPYLVGRNHQVRDWSSQISTYRILMKPHDGHKYTVGCTDYESSQDLCIACTYSIMYLKCFGEFTYPPPFRHIEQLRLGAQDAILGAPGQNQQWGYKRGLERD